MSDTDTTTRLEYLRGEIRAERISYGELAELQGLAEHIDRTDVELLEWAGVPEFEVTCDDCDATDESGWGDTGQCLDCAPAATVCEQHQRTMSPDGCPLEHDGDDA